MKDKGEKVKEVVTLLKKLIKVGIPTTDPGYKIAKACMDSWIKEDKDVHEEIPFMRYGRMGHLSLYSEEGKAAQFVLKVLDSAKDE
jgi:hypothetical protein